MKNKAIKDIYYDYRSQAKGRKLLFDLQLNEFINLISQDCFYCGQPPSAKRVAWNCSTKKQDVYIWNGIDRVENNEGYVKGNCVACCIKCNRMKMNLTIEEFFSHVSRIYNIHLKPRR